MGNMGLDPGGVWDEEKKQERHARGWAVWGWKKTVPGIGGGRRGSYMRTWNVLGRRGVFEESSTMHTNGKEIYSEGDENMTEGGGGKDCAVSKSSGQARRGKEFDYLFLSVSQTRGRSKRQGWVHAKKTRLPSTEKGKDKYKKVHVETGR